MPHVREYILNSARNVLALIRNFAPIFKCNTFSESISDLIGAQRGQFLIVKNRENVWFFYSRFFLIVVIRLRTIVVTCIVYRILILTLSWRGIILNL